VAWFDNPAEYYAELPQQDAALSQGDIVIAPTAIIFPGESESEVAGPTTLDETRDTTLWRASSQTLPGAPSFSSRTRWGLAMVVPHSCALDKEWNERIAELIEAGNDKGNAIREASKQDDLDAHITLASVLALETLPASKRAGVRMNRRLGNFPVCAKDDLPESFVDLTQLSTVHYSGIPQAQRIAALSSKSIAHLHFALAMHFAYRSLSGLKHIEDVVGRKIVDLNVAERAGGKLIVTLLLDDDREIVLQGDNRGVEAPVQESRPART
jgi:hypothetical protein